MPKSRASRRSDTPCTSGAPPSCWSFTPDVSAKARFARTYSKLRAFDLVEFDKIVFLDADTLVLRNIDELFARPRSPRPSTYSCRIASTPA